MSISTDGWVLKISCIIFKLILLSKSPIQKIYTQFWTTLTKIMHIFSAYADQYFP